MDDDSSRRPLPPSPSPARPGSGDRRGRRLLRLLPAASLALAALVALPPAAMAQQDLDVPYVPTPPEVVSQMLEMARPASGDTVYDLGSGDGRIVITAAERYGTPGVGVELDSGRVATARQNAAEAGVSDLVRFVRGDLFEADVSAANVVTLYLFPGVNRKLRPMLYEQLDPGDRVVSHDFNMGDWSADSVVNMDRRDGGSSTVYLWVMPVNVGGTWRLTLPGDRGVRVRLDQRYQEFRATFPEAPGGQVTGTRVRGDTVRFTLRGVVDDDPLRFTGTVEDGRMEGTTSLGDPWSARRLSADGDSSILGWEETSGGEAGSESGGDTGGGSGP